MIKNQNNKTTSNLQPDLLQPDLEELTITNMKGLQPMIKKQKQNYEKTETKILKMSREAKKNNHKSFSQGHTFSKNIKKGDLFQRRVSIGQLCSKFVKEQNKKQKFRNKLMKKVQQLEYRSVA